jgi:hypothetical protein
MNIADFKHILQQPDAITAQHTYGLKSIIDEFPYFQSARALYLKALKNKDSFKYNQELKTTATYTTDRSILFDFITSEVFLQNEISSFIKHNTTQLLDIPVDAEDISIQKSVTIDDALKQQIRDTTGVLDPELFQPKIATDKIANFHLDETEHINEIEDAEVSEPLSPDTILNLGKPLQFSHSETHSFTEWLMLTRFKPIDRTNEMEEAQDVIEDSSAIDKAKKFELIEKFIAAKPKLKPATLTTSNHNIAKAQMIQPESLMTETLARVYVEQKNYKKAIQSYKILSLKYPEKSGFFADRIKAVKQLQEQNKTE